MGEQVVEMVRGASMLKLWAAPRLGAEGRPVEDRRLVDVAVDGWVLGPLHVADYDPMSTLQAMSSVGTAPPGWGAVSLYGQGLGLRSHPGGTRAQLVEEGKRAALVMWEHVLQHVVARVGRDEVAVVEALRQVAPSSGRTLGELMIDVATLTAEAEQDAAAHQAACAALRQAEKSLSAPNYALDVMCEAVREALGLPAGEVPDVG